MRSWEAGIFKEMIPNETRAHTVVCFCIVATSEHDYLLAAWQSISVPLHSVHQLPRPALVT